MLGNRPMSEWIAQYSQSHQNSVNRFCHTIGIPLIALSIPLFVVAAILRRLWIVPLTLFVAEDPERAWAEIGTYLLADAASYSAWNAHRDGTASISRAATVASLAAEGGSYQIVTPAEARGLLAASTFPLNLQPLVGGLPPDLAWPYLEAAAAVSAGA